MDLDALMKLKIKFWNIIIEKLQNELPKIKSDFDAVIKTKDAKTIRQNNIQNNISSAETHLKELEQFLIHVKENSAFVEKPRDTIEEWALYRINRSYASVNNMSSLPQHTEPKDHFVFRLPLSLSFFSTETSLGYFEEIQTSLSRSPSFDGLKRRQLFCVDSRHPRDEWGQEQLQLFEVELII